jgi:hypothetical protein
MAKGDHIRVRRSGYWHHGIDCGDGTVVHFTGSPLLRKEARIEHTKFDDFTRGKKVEVVHAAEKGQGKAIVKRAKERVGETSYCLVRNNCEHFATWCATKKKKSRQVRKTITAAAGVVVVSGLTFVALRVVPSPYRSAVKRGLRITGINTA